jgi:hypothetical protein
VNVPDEELNRWADVGLRVANLLVSAQDAFRADRPEDAKTCVDDAHARLWRLIKAMVRAGASEPRERPAPSYDVPLELLMSETSQEYARALRRAAELAEAVDKERGWFPDGPAEIVSDWAEEAEFQAFGPKGGGIE